MGEASPQPAQAPVAPPVGGVTSASPGGTVSNRSIPTLRRERALWRSGNTIVAGMDEVGRGAWAGPLTVGVAVIAAAARRAPTGLRDSKLLAEDRRESLFEPVAAWCAGWAVGDAVPEECDRFGMTVALRLAAGRALAALPAGLLPDVVILDGNFDYVSDLAQGPGRPRGAGLAQGPGWPQALPPPLAGRVPVVHTVVGGDASCTSVAAASVLAKVTRDRMMRAHAHCYPPYDFDRNKGYPSPVHQTALHGYGLTAIHRRSWSYVRSLPWGPGGATTPSCAR